MPATIESIRIECACGKRARVPEKYAGRRVRCARCKSAIRVPGEKQGKVEARQRSDSRSRGSDSRSRQRSDSRSRHGSKSRKRSDSRHERKRAKASEPQSPYAPPKADMDAAPVRSRSRSQPERDLRAESHILALGAWSRIQGALLIAAGALFLVLGGIGGFMPAAMMLIVGGLWWWLGSATMNYGPTARIFQTILACLGGLGAVAGMFTEPGAAMLVNGAALAWHGAVCWAFYGARATRIYERGYRFDGRPVQWWLSPFFYLPILAFVLVFGISFTVGLML